MSFSHSVGGRRMPWEGKFERGRVERRRSLFVDFLDGFTVVLTPTAFPKWCLFIFMRAHEVPLSSQSPT